jgi:hypothetical protein
LIFPLHPFQGLSLNGFLPSINNNNYRYRYSTTLLPCLS